ncbi:ubiquitin-like protein 7 [Atheta coriaria]|uniref:ubiquitin-like protein 7 n=1 Tax=Dalotia coriaria TaxID=877792 RepID=UPI0031F3F403
MKSAKRKVIFLKQVKKRLIMSATAVLAIRLDKKLENRVKVDVDLEEKISLLREQASKTVQRPVQDLDLVYAGAELEDQHTLAFYSFKSGRTIHVLTKDKPKPLRVPKPLSDADMQRFLSAMEEYGHKNFVQKFPRKEAITKLLAAVPDIYDDTAALGLLNDPEMIVLFSDPDVLRKVLDSHPIIAEVLPIITTYLRENPITPSSSSTSNQASTSTANAYSLESLSDDEDMDNNPLPTTNNDTTREGTASAPRNSSYVAITTEQLSAALANARNFSSTDTNSSSASASNANHTSPPIITNEMFGNALQQAFTSVNNTNNSNTTPRSNPIVDDESLESLRTRLQPQLQQMRDMGLLDETQNIRALQLTSGDVQAAVEMVFGNDIDMNF